MSITSAYGKCLWRPTALVLKFGAAHVCKQTESWKDPGQAEACGGNAVSVSGLSTKGHCWLLLPRATVYCTRKHGGGMIKKREKMLGLSGKRGLLWNH